MTISNFNLSVSSSSTDTETPDLSMETPNLKKSRSPGATYINSFDRLPVVCINKIASFASNVIALTQTCRELNRLKPFIMTQLMIDFRNELNHEDFNDLKAKAKLHDTESGNTMTFKISFFVKDRVKDMLGGHSFLKENNFLPILWASHYYETQRWIRDENLLKFCTRLPGNKDFLESLSSTLSHSEKAKTMRMWIKNNMTAIANIEELNLEDLDLTELPPEIELFANLRNLLLADNKLRILPPEFGKLENLRFLELNNNCLSTVPREFGSLGNLRHLGIAHNRLVSLPEEFGQLVNLRRLYLGNNTLSIQPSAIERLVNLRCLDLSNNFLSFLSPGTGRLVNLRKLYLGNNGLVNLFPEIGQLVNLKTLVLDDNNLTILPLELQLLVNLKKFTYVNNSIIGTEGEASVNDESKGFLATQLASLTV